MLVRITAGSEAPVKNRWIVLEVDGKNTAITEEIIVIIQRRKMLMGTFVKSHFVSLLAITFFNPIGTIFSIVLYKTAAVATPLVFIKHRPKRQMV